MIWGWNLDYIEWKRLTLAEDGDHLIHFNAERTEQTSYDTAWQPDKRRRAFDRFEAFLSTVSLASGSGSAHKAKDVLRSFHDGDVRAHEADATPYLGAEVVGVDEFVGIKPAFSFANRTELLEGIGDAKLVEFDMALKSAVSSSSNPYKLRPVDNLRAQTKREIGRKLKELVETAVNRTSTGRSRRSSTGSSRGRVTTSAVRTRFDFDPLWVSTEAAVKAEVGEETLDSDPLHASGYAAGLKANLGLHSGRLSENSRDRKKVESSSPPAPGGATVGSSMTAFGLHFVLKIQPHSSAAARPTQPNIFCGGYDRLFVFRDGPTPGASTGMGTMKGRTVRLKSTKAHAHDASCACGAEGLPEAVLPFRTAAQQYSFFAKPFFVFADDFKYIEPEVDMIRAKNPV